MSAVYGCQAESMKEDTPPANPPLPYDKDFLPDHVYNLLQRQVNGGLISIDTFVNGLPRVPPNPDFRCPICWVDAGEEKPQLYHHPTNPGNAFTTHSDVYREQVTWLILSCCKQPIHRGCLVHGWLDPKRVHSDWTDDPKTTCTYCRQTILDREVDCSGGAKVLAMLRACKFLISGGHIQRYPSQDLPPGHQLNGAMLATVLALTFLIERENGNPFASEVLSKQVATAERRRLYNREYAPCYCRGQIFGEMMDAFNEVTLNNFGKLIGPARESGERSAGVLDVCTKAMSTALGLYQAHRWWRYSQPHVGED